MKRVFNNLFVAVAIILPLANAQAQVKKKPRVVDSAPTVVSEANSPAAAQNRVEIVRAAEVYKTSLRQLLAAREAEAADADERIAKLRELYRDGLISRLQFESAERELAEIHHRVEETRKQLATTDSLVVESIADTESNAAVDFDAMPTSRAELKKVAYIRFKGTADWSSADIGKIEEFFKFKFKRALPVVSPGQSETNTRWGYDHRNAVDVGLHPDSREGRALMSYLSKQGIPFMAFRRAVTGSATGPHIHIGKPAKKTTPAVR